MARDDGGGRRREYGYQITTLDNVQLTREVQQLQMSLHDIQKDSFKHFMLKEICEQPEVPPSAMRAARPITLAHARGHAYPLTLFARAARSSLSFLSRTLVEQASSSTGAPTRPLAARRRTPSQ